MSTRGGKKSQQYKSLISTLANGSTKEAIDLLRSKTGSGANDIGDLQRKLNNLWVSSSDKPEIEKNFATIHPHASFILKYLAPKEDVQSEKLAIDAEPNIIKLGESKSNAEGDTISDKCIGTEKMSGFTGDSTTSKNDNVSIISIIALVSIVGLIGLMVSKQK